MEQFLADYGLKWVGKSGQPKEGQFNEKAINEELKH
jgi:hypothetical protein